MSVAWFNIINELKRRPPQEYFTPSQRKAYDTIVDRLQFPNQRINLVGPPGVGKTYLAWGLVRALDAVHVPLPQTLRQYDGRDLSTLVIDNALNYEDDVRSLLADASLMDAGSVVLITHRPSQLRMLQVCIDRPNAEDLRQIARTLQNLGFYEEHAPPPSPSLWQFLQCYV